MASDMKTLKTTVFMVCSLVSSVSFATSFDCNKATNRSEIAICANGTLSALDDMMFDYYKKAMAVSVDPDALKRNQKEWIAETRTCGNNQSTTDVCLAQKYNERINQLRMLSETAQRTSPQQANSDRQPVPVNQQAVQAQQQQQAQPQVQTQPEAVVEKPKASDENYRPSHELEPGIISTIFGIFLTVLFGVVPFLRLRRQKP